MALSKWKNQTGGTIVGRGALCVVTPPFLASAGDSTIVTRAMAADWLIQPNRHLTADWALGFFKLECPKGSYVAGVSEETAPDNAFHAILCRTAGLSGTSPMARSLSSPGSAEAFPALMGWETDTHRAACDPSTEYMAGVSVAPEPPHAVQSVLCAAR